MQLGRLLRIGGLFLLLLVLSAGPFLRGLFFWTELLGAIAVTATGFGLWLLGRRLGGLSSGLPGGVAGWALLALLGLYVLQFAWAVYPRGNLDWVLRVAAACMAYMMVRAEAGPKLRQWLAWTFVASAVVLGVVGFLEYTGYLFRDPEVAKALSLVGLQTRMFTTMQYPNTAAVYFLAAMLAAFGLGLDDLKPWKLGLSGGLSTFLALAFFFTISRGALVVLPFGLALFFLGLGRDRRWPALLLLLAAVVPLVAVMQPVGMASAAKHTAAAFRWLLAASAGGLLVGVLVGGFIRLRGRTQGILALGLMVAVVGALVAFKPAGGYLPRQAERLLDMDFNTPSVFLRLTYYQDAVQLATDRPLGRGGWGWDRGYRQYQSFNYTARETHSHYAQTAVEAGFPGLVALVIALGTAMWATWQNRRAGTLAWSLAAGAGLVAGHAAIDFTLSFGSVWLLLWVLLAAAAEPAPDKIRRVWALPGSVLSTVVAGACAALAAGAWYADQATTRAATDQDTARIMAAKAVRLDPLASEPGLVLGGHDRLTRAAKLDPFHSGIRFQLAVAKELGNDLHGALEEAKAALTAQPLVSVYWSKVAALSGTLMHDAVYRGERAEAERLAKQLVAMGQEFGQRKAVADPLQKMWGGGAQLKMSADFQLRYGQALFLTGKPGEAEPLLVAASKVGLHASEADIWLHVIYEQLGETKKLEALAGKPWVRFRGQNPVFKHLKEWQ